MSPQEAQIVEAASSLEWARCVNGGATPGLSVRQEASRFLGTAPNVQRWLYGAWDVQYLSQNGWRGPLDPPLTFTVTGPGVAEQCQQALNDAGLAPILWGEPTDTVGSNIATASLDAYDKTMVDSGFVALLGRWRTCVSSAGYEIDPESNTSPAKKSDSWSDEQTLKAWLAEATCADGMSYTQQVANITAGYQMEYIRTHEAELVQTKRIADERVAKATQILKDAGVL